MKSWIVCIIALCTLSLTIPVSAAAAEQISMGPPIHNITITPGQPWQMIVHFRLAAGIPVERHGNYYLAYIGHGPPLDSGLYARMYVEQSTADPTATLLRLTAEQTTALAGKTADWSMVYIPDVGSARKITGGKVEVKK